MISHWPKTATAAIPFLGSPELLSLDRSRQIHDSIPKIAALGWEAIGPKEPRGRIRLSHLNQRLSRRLGLEALLGSVAFGEASDREALKSQLEAASTRLGPPKPQDTFADARLMARYALNVIDPTNWQPGEMGPTYVPPPDEARHIAALQAERAPRTRDFEIDVAIQKALEDSERSSAELAEHAVAYAKRLETAAHTPEDVLHSRTNAIVSAAMIVARDGADQLLDVEEDWVRQVFSRIFERHDQYIGTGTRDGIRFNPVAIATLGLVHLWRRYGRVADRDALLNLAGRDIAEAAPGFGSGLQTIWKIDRRLVGALLRCAFTAQIRPTGDWDDPEEKKEVDRARHRERVASSIAAERAWLQGDAKEPAWPRFPDPVVYRDLGPRIGAESEVGTSQTAGVSEDQEVRSQSAALWVRQLTRGLSPPEWDWLNGFVDTYADWTANANGAGDEPLAEVDYRQDGWNTTFNRLLVNSFVGRNVDDIAAGVARAIDVPEDAFFKVATVIIPEIDRLYFERLGLDLDTALRMRSLVVNRMVQSNGWRWESNRSELSVGMKIGPAIGVLFFCEYSSFVGARCYLLDKGIDQLAPFLPQLTRLIEDGPVPVTALLTMALLEVGPKPEHAEFFLSSALTWLRRQPTNTILWVDSGLGAQLVKWMQTVTESEASLRSATHPLRPRMEEVLARLVQVGVPEAHRLEREIEAAHLRNQSS